MAKAPIELDDGGVFVIADICPLFAGAAMNCALPLTRRQLVRALDITEVVQFEYRMGTTGNVQQCWQHESAPPKIAPNLAQVSEPRCRGKTPLASTSQPR